MFRPSTARHRLRGPCAVEQEMPQPCKIVYHYKKIVYYSKIVYYYCAVRAGDATAL